MPHRVVLGDQAARVLEQLRAVQALGGGVLHPVGRELVAQLFPGGQFAGTQPAADTDRAGQRVMGALLLGVAERSEQLFRLAVGDVAEVALHVAARLLGDREQIKRMRDSIVERKLITHFKAMLSPKEERMSLDAFINLVKNG